MDALRHSATLLEDVLSDAEGARGMHNTLVQMSRWEPTTVVAQAQFFQRQGATEQVEALYEEALIRCGHDEFSYNLASADPDLLVEYAAVVMGTRPEQAEELLRWAVENEPYHVRALCILASVLHSTMQRSQEAEEVLEIALSRAHSTLATVQLEKCYDTVSRAKVQSGDARQLIVSLCCGGVPGERA